MSRRNRTVLWVSLLSFLFIVATIGYVSASDNRFSRRLFKAPSRPALSTSAPEFKQRLRIWVTASDIRPRVVHAWPGKAEIEAMNETAKPVTLQIDRIIANGTKTTAEKTLSVGLKPSREVIALGVGEYSVYDASQPAKRITLIVEPRQ